MKLLYVETGRAPSLRITEERYNFLKLWCEFQDLVIDEVDGIG